MGVPQSFANSALYLGGESCVHAQPSGCKQQCPAIPAESIPGWKGLFVCMLWCPPVPAGSSSGRGDWGVLQWHCRLAREPGWSLCPLSMCRGNKQWCSWIVPSAPENSCSSQPSLCGLSLRCCSEAVQLALRRNYFKYRCTFHVFLEGSKFSILLGHHLGPPSR